MMGDLPDRRVPLARSFLIYLDILAIFCYNIINIKCDKEIFMDENKKSPLDHKIIAEPVLQLDKKSPMDENKKSPLDRKIVAQPLLHPFKGEWPGWPVVFALAFLLPIGLFSLLYLANMPVMDITATVLLAAFGIFVADMLLNYFLVLFGKYTVSVDALCCKEQIVRHSRHGTETYYYLYFSHHGRIRVSASQYAAALEGELYFVLATWGHRFAPLSSYPMRDYEWVGKPEELNWDVSDPAKADPTAEPPDGGDTIFERRPITRGRKETLTREEIARDLLENRLIGNDKLVLLIFGVLLLGGALCLVSLKAAAIYALTAGVAMAIFLVCYFSWEYRVKKRKFTVVKDTLMDRDVVIRGRGRLQRNSYVFSFRQRGTYTLPQAHAGVYHASELGDSFYLVFVSDKAKHASAVYNALDYRWEED